MGGFGGTELLVVVAILILFFGAKKIPELARGIGQGMNEFKKATSDELDSHEKEQDVNQADRVESTNNDKKKQRVD